MTVRLMKRLGERQGHRLQCDTGRVSESIELRRVDGVCGFGELSGTNAMKMRVESVVVEDITQLILIRSLLRSRTQDLSYMGE